MTPFNKGSYAIIAASLLRGSASKEAVFAALLQYPGALHGLIEPVFAGFQSLVEGTAEFMREAGMRGPPPLQAAVLALLGDVIAQDQRLAEVSASVPESEGAGAASPAGSVGSAACATVAIRAISGIAPKIDSSCPAEAVDRLVASLFACLEAAASTSRSRVGRGGGGGDVDVIPAAKVLGLLGRSKKQRPFLVARLVQLLEKCLAASHVPAPLGSEAFSPESVLDREPDAVVAGGQAVMLRSACTSALFDIAGCPGAKPDMGPALCPLVALMSPSVVAAAFGADIALAASALYRLSAHPPFLAELRASKLPGFLEALHSGLVLGPHVASAVAALQQSLSGGGLAGSKLRGLAQSPTRGLGPEAEAEAALAAALAAADHEAFIGRMASEMAAASLRPPLRKRGHPDIPGLVDQLAARAADPGPVCGKLLALLAGGGGPLEDFLDFGGLEKAAAWLAEARPLRLAVKHGGAARMQPYRCARTRLRFGRCRGAIRLRHLSHLLASLPSSLFSAFHPPLKSAPLSYVLLGSVVGGCLLLAPDLRPKTAAFIASRPGLDLASLAATASDPLASLEEVSYCCSLATLSALDATVRAALIRDASRGGKAGEASFAAADSVGQGGGILRTLACRMQALGLASHAEASSSSSSSVSEPAAVLLPAAANAAACLAVLLAAEPPLGIAEVLAARSLCGPDVLEGLACLLEGGGVVAGAGTDAAHPVHRRSAASALLALCRTPEAESFPGGALHVASAMALFGRGRPEILGRLLLGYEAQPQPMFHLRGLPFAGLPDPVRAHGAPAVALYLGLTARSGPEREARGGCLSALLSLVEGATKGIGPESGPPSPEAALKAQAIAALVLVSAAEATRSSPGSVIILGTDIVAGLAEALRRPGPEGNCGSGGAIAVEEVARPPRLPAVASAAPALAAEALAKIGAARQDLMPAVVVGLVAALSSSAADSEPGETATAASSSRSCQVGQVGERHLAAVCALKRVAAVRRPAVKLVMVRPS